ncbi:MAG: glycosyltransferase [Sphingobacteriaceae bacterium]|nr:MAG: glycosyltransferase [Sphingobacteriaceae bacterium]
MKIIQVTASYKPAVIYGGPTMSVSKLSEQLNKNNIDTEVVTTLANGKTELGFPVGKVTRIENVPVRFFKRITKDHSHFSPGLIKYLLKLRKSETTIVHIHAWWNLVSMFGCAIAQLKKIPVVLSPRGTLSNYSFNNKHNLFKFWIHLLAGKKLLSNCCFHVTSEAEKSEILQLINPEKIQVISNFLTLPIRFDFKSDRKSAILKLLLILPSYNENFGNVVIESLAVGTPVLISNKVGLADYIIKNKLGWTFENQPEKLRKALTEINTNKSELDEIRFRSPQKIKEDFSDEMLVNQYINFYKEVITDYN